MKILFITEHPIKTKGGIQKHVSKIGFYLSDKYEIRYLSAAEVSQNEIFGKKLIFSIASIVQKIKAIKPNIIHVHGFSSFFVQKTLVACASFPKIKVVYTPHYHPFEYHTRPWAAKFFFHLFLKPSLENVDKLIVLSESEKDFFSKWIHEDKICKIPNGIEEVDNKFYKSKPVTNTLLFIGRNDSNKRLDFLLGLKNCFREKKVFCKIVTDKAPFPSNDVFTFYENVSDAVIQMLYEESTIVVVPSRYEAFSIVALEAMAKGLGLLLSDRVRFAEYLEPQMMAKIFAYNDKSDFCKNLDRLLTIDSKAYAEYSRRHIEYAKKFIWKKITEQIEKECYR